MKSRCRSCGMAFPVNPEFIGCSVQCPHCGSEHTLSNSDIIRTAPPQAQAENPKTFSGLGFALGLFLNIPGVFIAALVSGRVGAISALWGLLIDGLIVVLGYALMAVGM